MTGTAGRGGGRPARSAPPVGRGCDTATVTLSTPATSGPDDTFGGRAFAPRADGTVVGVGVDVVDIPRRTR